jgi:signal transduction histidine kinase
MNPMQPAPAAIHPSLPDPQPLPWLRFMLRFQALPKWLTALLIALLALLVGSADYITGWELSLFIFYAIPIILAVWLLGSRAGMVAAALCSIIWLVANEASHPYETLIGYNWAMLSRLFYFSVVVFAVSAVRNKQKADASRIKMLEERRQLELDIVSVSEHEQQRIGQDLHDGLCQHLAAIGCAARVLADELHSLNRPESRDANMIEEAIQHAMLEARNLARGIFPVHVDRTGLAAALVDLAQMMGRLTGTQITVENSDNISIDSPEASMHLYRIAQEAVANAIRHSGASTITISLLPVDDGIELRVADNGSGITADAGEQCLGMGLRTMRYRAEVLGGVLNTIRLPSGGTLVTCRFQIQPSST